MEIFKIILMWLDPFTLLGVLSLPFLMRIFASNGVRFAALSIPLVLYAIAMRPKHTKKPLLYSLACYQFIQYVYWARLF